MLPLSPPPFQVYQEWQDADVVTLYKMKGNRKDPTNYRGIFLLDIAGKILASVIDARIKKLIERNVSDTQCGFRPRRSTSHLIHILRRAQEACRVSNLKAYAVFIDFKKALILPQGKRYESVWSG
jgi:hypothetical protein